VTSALEHSTLALNTRRLSTSPRVGLYTILPPPILYGVWHEKGGSVGGVYCAMGVRVGFTGGGAALKG